MSTDAPWRQYICRACGLIYDEAEGDPDSGLVAGTRFEDIPDDWECPLCGVTKSDFEPFEAPVTTGSSRSVVVTRTPGVVIIGAGISGWAIAEAIRALDEDIPITLVSACGGDRYHKPELSVAISRGLDIEKLVQESAESASQRLQVRLLAHTYAVGISPDSRQIRTTRGTLRYTDLILAQGAKPFLPDALSGSEHWHMNHLSKWAQLREALGDTEQHVAIVGAGMIGCEVAEDLGRAGHRVTLINDKPSPLASLLPPAAADRLVDALTALGVTYIGGATITSTSENKHGQHSLMLSDGRTITYDQLIVATGLITDTRIAERAGLAFERGIVVDPVSLRTSDDHIYALGDCVSFDGVPCRFVEPIPHQARSIASQIIHGQGAEYQHAQPVIRLKTRSLPIVIRGIPEPDREWHTVSSDEGSLVMEQHDDHQTVASLTLDLSRQARAA